jgi:hypothetical protein
MFEKQPWMQRAGEYPQTDQEYFALLARAVFSAGLGPKVVESRWAALGEAFRGFDPAQVRLMDEQDVTRLLGDPGVIRNRRKIEAVIKNAGTFLEQLEEQEAACGAADGDAVAPGAGGTKASGGKARGGKAAAGALGAHDASAANGHAPFHHYLLDLGAGADLDLTADALAQSFSHLGRTSALFFLFSAGWRPHETTDLGHSQAAPAEGLVGAANG